MIVFMNTERRTSSGDILPLDAGFAWWHERVNAGAQFRFRPKDFLIGPNGQPTLRLPLAEAGEDSYCFNQIALYLYNANLGALLCQSDEDVSESADHFPMSYGDVVDYLQTGQLLDRVPCTPPWGYPDGAFRTPDSGSGPAQWLNPEKFVGKLEEPNFVVLPMGVRRNMALILKNAGTENARVSVFRSPQGRQFLWIMYQSRNKTPLSDDLSQQIADSVIWCLPRYYAALIAPADNADGYPLLPKQA